MTNLPLSLGRGILEGAGIDQIIWGAAMYFPELQQSSGIPIPGYDPVGIHYDDIISLAAGGTVAGIGVGLRKPDVAVEGVGMMFGAFIASQLQNMAGAALSMQVPTGIECATRKATAMSRELIGPSFMF